jgi:hypothetical protein
VIILSELSLMGAMKDGGILLKRNENLKIARVNGFDLFDHISYADDYVQVCASVSRRATP